MDISTAGTLREVDCQIVKFAGQQLATYAAQEAEASDAVVTSAQLAQVYSFLKAAENWVSNNAKR